MNSLHQHIAKLSRLTGMTALSRKFCSPGLSILMFHGITKQRHSGIENAYNLHIDETLFQDLCRVLSQDYNVLPLTEAVKLVTAQAPLPPNSVVLTFDDGYASNYHLAYPILSKHKLPATIFVATDFVHNNIYLWPDRLEYALQRTSAAAVTLPFSTALNPLPITDFSEKRHACDLVSQHLKSLPQEDLYAAMAEIEAQLGFSLSTADHVPAIYQPLNWEQCREMMASDLITLGGHTHRHLILGRCTDATAREELTLNADLLTANTGLRPTLFAYPNGKPEDYNATTRQLLVELGYQGAVTTTHSFVQSADNPDVMALPRFGHYECAAQLDFVASGFSNFIKRTVLQRPRAALASF
jgi:peptidoglycan/xylan/chitin deacetylase (PgdA/CDA1 family)